MGNFSATALETYIRCPQQYAYKYQEKLWPHRPDDPMLQGQLFHQLMEHLVQQCMTQHTAITSLNAKNECESFLNQTAIYQKMISAGADPLETLTTLQELLSAQLELEIQWGQITHASPAITELKASFLLKNTHEMFDIRIDRVDRTDQGFWLIDYKTQSTPPSWAELYRFQYLQPWLYSMYGLTQYQKNFLGFVYFLPKLKMIRPVIIFQEEAYQVMSEWVPQKSKLLPPSLIPEKTEEAGLFVQELIQKIQRQEFAILNPPTQTCRVCSYRTFCKILHPG